MYRFLACKSDALVRRQQLAAAMTAARNVGTGAGGMVAPASATGLIAIAIAIAIAAIAFADATASSRADADANACTGAGAGAGACVGVGASAGVAAHTAGSIAKLQPHAIAMQQHQLAIDARERGKHRILLDLGNRQA